MTRDEIADTAAHILLDVEFYGFACKQRAEGELIDCAKPLHHVKTGVDRLTGEIVRLAGVEYELARLRSDCVALAAWQCVYPDGLTGLTHDETGNATCRKDAELARLRAENERLRADAERHRWMRDNPSSIPYRDEMDVWCVPYLVSNAGGHGGGVGESRHKSLDAAIDAAMAQGKV